MSSWLPKSRLHVSPRFRRRVAVPLMVSLFAVASVSTACGYTERDADHAVSLHEQFVEEAGTSALTSQKAYQVPASVTVAQAILESGWGDSELSREANNYFGMKCKDGDFGEIAVGCVKKKTHECDKKKCWNTKAWFRDYDSREDSFTDHGSSLDANDRYDKAFDHSDDADAFIREVHEAGYATDPDYADKIIDLMNKHDLYRFNKL